MNHAMNPRARSLLMTGARVAHRWLAVGALSALAACSGGSADDLELEDGSMGSEGDGLELGDERPTLEQREAEFQRAARGSLTDEEVQQITELLMARGVPFDSVRVAGRLIVRDGDTYEFADALLASASEDEELEKGKLPAQVLGEAAPDLFARQVDGFTQFWRPDLRLHFLVVPDAAPEFVVTLLQSAVDTVNSSNSSDCLNGSAFSVLRQRDYDARDEIQRAMSFATTIVYAPLDIACPNLPVGTAACARHPRKERVTISINPVATQSRMRFGNRLALVDSVITGDDATNRGIVLHELGHTLGLAHPEADEIDSAGPDALDVVKIVVHGTLGGTAFPSVMHATTGGQWTPTLSQDDAKMIRTLYSNYQDGNLCSYVDGFRTPPVF